MQQEANRKFSYSAAKTLIITQALYEKHKAVTYPRTDANVLPSDYVQTAEQVLDALATSYPASSTVIDNNWVQLQNANKRIFNDALISDHFAIVPTDKVPSGLSSDEKNIYELIVKRFIAVFYPAAEYNHTKRITCADDNKFITTGNVLIIAEARPHQFFSLLSAYLQALLRIQSIRSLFIYDPSFALKQAMEQ